VIYAFVFAGLYGLDELAGWAVLALDPLIQRRISAWRFIAARAADPDRPESILRHS
jgi:hypothetical protein